MAEKYLYMLLAVLYGSIQGLVTALIMGVDEPLFVGIATVLVSGPVSYLSDRIKSPKRKASSAFSTSALAASWSGLVGALLSSRGFNAYDAVCYSALFASASVFFGLNKVAITAIKIAIRSFLDTAQRKGWLDDE